MGLSFTNCIILGKLLYSETILLPLSQNDHTFQIDFIGPGKGRMNNVYENTLEIWKAILKYEAWSIYICIYIFYFLIFLRNTWELGKGKPPLSTPGRPIGKKPTFFLQNQSKASGIGFFLPFLFLKEKHYFINFLNSSTVKIQCYISHYILYSSLQA